MNFLSEGFYEAMRLLLAWDEETFSAVYATLQTSSLSIIISILFGLPAGFALGYFSFPGKRIFRLIVDTLLSLPTVVVGLVAYAFISRRAPLGEYELLFTITGIALAQAILIFPIITSLTATAIESLDPRAAITMKTLGANTKQQFLHTILEARFAVMAAIITGYSRAISEVGISMMIGGNIKWDTRTITTAMALETGKGDFAMGIALGLVLLFIGFVANWFLILVKKLNKQ